MFKVKVKIILNKDKISLIFHRMLWKIIDKYGRDKSMTQIREYSNFYEKIQLAMCKKYFLKEMI